MRNLRAALALALLAFGLLAAGTGASPATPDAAVRSEGVSACSDPCAIAGVIKQGAGTVRSSPVGIDCGTQCFSTWSQIDPVELEAVPASGGTFLGWGDGMTTANACPQPNGNLCYIPADTSLYCVMARFSGSGPPPQACRRRPLASARTGSTTTATERSTFQVTRVVRARRIQSSSRRLSRHRHRRRSGPPGARSRARPMET